MDTIQSHEALLEQQVAEARKELAEAHGLTIDTQPAELEEGQRAALRETFGAPGDVMQKKLDEIRATGRSTNEAGNRLNIGRSTVEKLRAGEAAECVRPMDQWELGGKEADVTQKAEYARAAAVQGAANVLGVNERQLPAYLDNAEVGIYNSPENGAPIITERTITLPGGVIHEMNLHGAGSAAVMDTQVVVTPR